MTSIKFPNESDAYRRARNELLDAEMGLRAEIERVAKLRRRLPLGGEIKEDYEFDELVDGQVKKTKLSQLFAEDKVSLFVQSFMYAPNMDAACPMCTSMLDGMDGQVRHINQQINTAVVAKHDIHTIHQHAKSRGWRNLRLLSSANNTYNADYFGEIDGHQVTNANIFVKEGRTIRHFWNSEMSMAPAIEGGNMRHMDMLWPLWNVLDLTPQGRGATWYPSLSYG